MKKLNVAGLISLLLIGILVLAGCTDIKEDKIWDVLPTGGENALEREIRYGRATQYPDFYEILSVEKIELSDIGSQVVERYCVTTTLIPQSEGSDLNYRYYLVEKERDGRWYATTQSNSSATYWAWLGCSNADN